MKKFPKTPQPIIIGWRDGEKRIAVTKTENDRIRLYIWDGIAKHYNEFYTFEKL